MGLELKNKANEDPRIQLAGEEQAALKIQSRHRGNISRKGTLELKNKANEDPRIQLAGEEQVALKIQSRHRGNLERKKTLELKDKLLQEQLGELPDKAVQRNPEN